MKKKVIKAYKNELSHEYLEKIKENSKIFDEKMNTLNKRKIKVIKPKSKRKEIKKPKDNPQIFSIKKENQFNFSSPKKREIQYIMDRVKQMSILNKKKQLLLSIDNNISLYYLSKNSKGTKNYSEEEQDIFFLSKIRQLQKDLKYKTDLILDLQNKLKGKGEDYIYISRNEINELNNSINNMTKEKDEKIRRIKQLETDNYNQRCTIDNLEAKINKIKSEIKGKDEEIYNLTNVIDKFKIEEGLYEQKVNCLESVKKSSIRDIELLKKDLNKIATEKEKLEKIIEDQRTKMENYRKHINTLRKFICEDDYNHKLNIGDIIVNNNEIIDKKYNTGIIKSRSKSKKNIIQLNEEKKNNTINNNDFDNKEENEYKSNGNNDDDINEENRNNQITNNANEKDNENKINNLENKINNLENKINNLENKKNNLEIITSYDFKKGHHKTNSDLNNSADKKVVKINPYVKFNNKSRIKNRNKEQTVSSLRKNRNKKNNDDEFDEDDDIYYNTYNNLNDYKKLSRSQKKLKDDRFNTEYEIGFFPCERHLLERKDEIENLELQLDLLLGQKNELENEILKLPEHPKTLKEIKRKRSLNGKLLSNERNINNIRIKIRKMKEY